jgi:hypothetical protein
VLLESSVFLLQKHCCSAKNDLTEGAYPGNAKASFSDYANCLMANITQAELPPTFTSSLTFPSFYFTETLSYVYIHLYFFTFPGAVQNTFLLITPQSTATG